MSLIGWIIQQLIIIFFEKIINDPILATFVAYCTKCVSQFEQMLLFNLTVPVIQCGPPPPAPKNGSSTHTGTSFSDKTRYSCDEGYRLEGNRVVLCEATGLWGTAPSCESKHTEAAISESGVLREFALVKHMSPSFILFIINYLFYCSTNQTPLLV